MRKLALVAVIGLAAQLVDGALGMAYGATSTSLLLSAGLAPAVVSATVHLAEIGTTAASGAAHGGSTTFTLGEALGASGEQITTLTVIVAVLWAASVAVAIAAVRREPEPA